MQTIKKHDDYDVEIILVNDASPDHTYQTICELQKQYPCITGIDFAKNFGQHAALMAGIREAEGDIVVCLDDDGQTPPSEMFKLINAIEAGADAAYARYSQKKHSAFRNFGSWVNEKMACWLLGKPDDLYVSSYFAIRQFVAQEIKKYDSPYPYLIGLVLRSTSNIVNVDVDHRARTEGKSGYSLKKLFALWMNGFTAFSVKPLRLASLLGGMLSALSAVYGAYIIVRKILNPAVPAGWSSTVCLIAFIGGLLMAMLGLIGEYIGRIYISQNKAPQYVIREIERKRDL